MYMRIAQIAPIIERVPPKMYGGTERVVSVLTEGLVKLGHEVTLFASGDSETKAKLVSCYQRGLREARLANGRVSALSLLNIGLAYQDQGRFDIIHDHSGPLSLPVAEIASAPVVMTVHGPFTSENKLIFQALRRPYIVTISRDQARSAPYINHAGTIYHGLPLREYPFQSEPGKYLLFVGRISQLKGLHHAIEVAQYTNMELLIAAKLDSADKDYFYQEVKPYLSDRVRWLGEVSAGARNELMAGAYCFLHPAMWREPFGLTLIEAAATGCPVIAFGKGSIPEIVIDGKTGFVVDNVDEMITAVSRVKEIDRRVCREHVLENFNDDRMVSAYEKLYEEVIADKRTKSRVTV